MESTTSHLLVSLFFIHATFGTAVLAWKFLSNKKITLRYFGWGMLGYALALALWTLAVIIKPADLRPLIFVGVVPFLLAHIAYAKAASVKWPNMANAIMGLTVVLLIATFIARTFFFKSDPYISSKGLLYFGLKPVPIALYIATISVSFLPAINAVTSIIKGVPIKSIMSIGLMTLYVNAIILVSSQNSTLLLINGAVISLALLVLWVKSINDPLKV
jgi:hypothetical protein